MKKRYLLPAAALLLAAALCLLLLSPGGVCIGRIETQLPDQWSHLHMYLNDALTVHFPIDEADQPCAFQYETGRGAFSVIITDAEGNTVYSDISSRSGIARFTASSDLTVRIRGWRHGGTFAISRQEQLLVDESGAEYLLLGEGVHTEGDFTAAYDCSKVNGKKVNFFVENRGTEPVTISINGSYTRVIPAGLFGHVSAPISVSIREQTMTLECTCDGDIDIYWKAAQRN